MKTSFDADPYPGRPKILFVGFSESTHTHSWIGLLEGAGCNVRLFGLPTSVPPEGWDVRTYITSSAPMKLDPTRHVRLYSPKRFRRWAKKGLAELFIGGSLDLEERWMARVIQRWRPDIIHTLGLEPAGHLYHRVRERFGLAGIGKWVLQLRGGSDLTLTRLDPELSRKIAYALNACDQILTDNKVNFRYAADIGVNQGQFSALCPVPGTGGIDVDTLSRLGKGPPSGRRLILWPKAYESTWSKALPVFEALKMCWEKIQPCEVQMLSMLPGNEARLWYRTMPEEIRRTCHARDRLPRTVALDLMAQARVMLAPSLVEGVPNSMYEAMAAGAFPIVSPLETVTSVVEDERNVLFARNLYPHEIAEALVRAMNDDALVDAAAERNLQLVRERADRAKIAPRVVEYYEDLAKTNRMGA